MDQQSVEQATADLLATVDALPGVGGWRVPHGFAVTAVTGEEERNPFSGLPEWRVAAELTLPVIYSYTTRRGAHLPSDRSNLDELRALVADAAHHAAHRVSLAEWRVSPEEDPSPKKSKDDPDAMWTVTALFRVV
jgi:hypothetical protein